jgi:VanZ family protein
MTRAYLHRTPRIRWDRHEMMTKPFKAAAWICLLSLVVLTVIPGDERPVSGFQHDWEHFIAFCPAGFLLGLGYANRFRWLYPVAIAFTLALELSQIPLTDRHARVDDFIVDAVAACLGLAVAQAFRTMIKQATFERLPVLTRNASKNSRLPEKRVSNRLLR